MNNYNSNSIGNSGHSQGLRADTLYTTSPDAVQRVHPHLQLRSGKAYVAQVTYDHPWSSMRDFARLLALRYEALRTDYLISPAAATPPSGQVTQNTPAKHAPRENIRRKQLPPRHRTRRATKSIPSANIAPTQNAQGQIHQGKRHANPWACSTMAVVADSVHLQAVGAHSLVRDYVLVAWHLS